MASEDRKSIPSLAHGGCPLTVSVKAKEAGSGPVPGQRRDRGTTQGRKPARKGPISFKVKDREEPGTEQNRPPREASVSLQHERARLSVPGARGTGETT